MVTKEIPLKEMEMKEKQKKNTLLMNMLSFRNIIRCMKIIGQNINLDIITQSKNTLFF